jgi:hypothetical protein
MSYDKGLGEMRNDDYQKYIKLTHFALLKNSTKPPLTRFDP